ncbi:MAG: aspartate aminotransferase family protein [Proteobacteria bacterium]|nr:aspartate aminotransferase family protein [Pseudomonadota bacterium]
MRRKPGSSDPLRAQAVFPAGSNGEFNLPPELAIVIARGEGCRLWDTTGKEFLDLSMGWGSALVGHARPEVTAAVVRQAPRGGNFSYITDQALHLAEEIVRLSPACKQVRFCASGTEATFYCLRLARAHTGRSYVLKFEGAYHGAHDVGVTSLFPDRLADFPEPVPSSAGVVDERVLIAPYNDLAKAHEIIRENAVRLAAVIVEPLQRCTPPLPGFLEGLRQATAEHDVLLIFDEVVTGFRLAYGGAQKYYGVVPDLVAYGKGLGGGYPIGAFGGGSEIMAHLREDRLGQPDYVWMASTLGGNPVSAAAAYATLGVLRQPGTYQHLHDIGRYLRDELRKILAARQQTAQVIGDGPLAQVVFSREPVINYRTTKQGDAAKGRKLMLALFKRGVFLNPMGTKLYLSIAHTREMVDQALSRFDDALAEVG